MSDDTEAARQQAQRAFEQNQQAEKAREQDFRSYQERIAYDAELERQRQSAGQSS